MTNAEKPSSLTCRVPEVGRTRDLGERGDRWNPATGTIRHTLVSHTFPVMASAQRP
jgi:hypothetical protein